MSSDNPYKPVNLKLSLHKKLIWLISMIGCGIYAIIVIFILLSNQIPASVKLITVISYMIIGPLTIYLLWLLFYVWKTKKYPPSEKLVSGRNKYLLMLFLMGICVVNFAAYWNSGIMELWFLAANGVYYFTGDEVLAVVFYYVGAYAIFIFYFALILFFKEKNQGWKIAYISAAFFILLALIFSGTRGAYVGLGISTMVALLIYTIKGQLSKFRIASAVMLGIIVISATFLFWVNFKTFS